MHRRAALLCGGALLLAPLARAAPRGTRLAAAWDDAQGRHFAGWLDTGGDTLRVRRTIELPTRAHGLLVEPDGALLVVARRPGDWLLRWPAAGAAQWQWSAPDRRFGGHVLAHGGRLFTTEADLDSGAGRVVVRERRSLEVIDDWPSHGIDTHQLIADADGSLLVANGGVPTQPESGRAKLARDMMDSSLLRLDARDGRRLGQWRLPDPRLSLRHLARHPSGVVGIALQAEHDDAAQRDAAPLLALFDGQALRCPEQPPRLAGYGGDVAAEPDGFVVAATRAGRLARWSAGGAWAGSTLLPEACALARDGGTVWAGGRPAAWHAGRTLALPGLRLDNHWVSAGPDGSSAG